MTDSSKKKILIIGASGFIGQALYKGLNTYLSENYDITGTYCNTRTAPVLERLDVTKYDELEQMLLKLKPDFILIAAGNKNILDCEKEFLRGYAVNTQPVESIIAIISRNQLPSRVIYYSTDYVFDGKRGHYQDNDLPQPVTNYGRTKYLAEQVLVNSDIDYKIIRTAAVIGSGGTFFDWLLNEMATKRTLAMYDNVYFSPTPLSFLTEMTCKLIENYEYVAKKVLHIVGEQRLSRYQFGCMVQNILNTDIHIVRENKPDNSPFQFDLSLESSDIINTWRGKQFMDYLRDEIQNAVFR